MKTLLTSILLFSVLLINAQESQNRIMLKRVLVEKQGTMYYVYDKNDSCIFTKLNRNSKKEEILPVCYIDMYESYLNADKKTVESISLQKVLKNIDNSDRFKELVSLSDF